MSQEKGSQEYKECYDNEVNNHPVENVIINVNDTEDCADLVNEDEREIENSDSISTTSFSSCQAEIDFPGRASTEDEKEIESSDGTSTTSYSCLLYTSPSPRDLSTSRMPSSA